MMNGYGFFLLRLLHYIRERTNIGLRGLCSVQLFGILKCHESQLMQC